MIFLYTDFGLEGPYVGPDNGPFAIVARHAARWQWSRLAWRPDGSTFSG